MIAGTRSKPRAFALSLACGAASLALVATCGRNDSRASSGANLEADSPDGFGTVGEFELVERSGRSVRRADLEGRVWVVGFVFTRCTGPCPKVTGHMRELQDELAATQARLLTFSVDPLYDTPEVLRGYAESVGADPERWWMLTGEQRTIDALMPTFLSTNTRTNDGSVPVGSSIAHQTRLSVIDKHGRVRGLYSGESGDQLELIVARVKHLEGEP